MTDAAPSARRRAPRRRNRTPTPAELEAYALALLDSRSGAGRLAERMATDVGAFRAHWHVTPQAFQEAAAEGGYTLHYDGPFHVRETLRYLGRDAGNLAERVAGDTYRRLLAPAGTAVPVALHLGPRTCRVEVGAGLPPWQWLALHRQVLRALGLDQPLAPFYEAAAEHEVLGPLTRRLQGVRVPQVPDLWEALCWAVIGQQINLPFAYRLRNRLIALGNGYADEAVPPAALPLPFPTPDQVAGLSAETLRAAQFSRQKAGYLQGLARSFADGVLADADLRGQPPERAAAALLRQKGLGPWSVAYVQLRALGHWDALPVGDAGLKAALRRHFDLPGPPDVATQEALMEPLRPWRGLATYYLWKSLSLDRQE